ncbi:MAG: hypothetical protein J0I07_11225 [Myxococcales bacterium]|nr:hypothetical protein [Myxococcales bacterium]
MPKRVRRSTPNRGGWLLRRTGVDGSELARDFGVSGKNISFWQKGPTKPSPEKRQLALRLYKIPIAAWDEPIDEEATEASVASSTAAASVVPPTVSEHSDAGEEASFEATAGALTSYIQAELGRIQRDSNATPKEREIVIRGLTTTLEKVGRITGAHAFDKAKIIASREFRQIVSTISEAVRPWPDAAGAIERALLRLEGR